MRDILFRVWEKPQEDFKGKMWTDNDPKFWASCLMNNKDEYELSQYTGLKDKNGVLIYEGDILEFETPGGTQRPYVSYEPLLACFVVDYWKKGQKESKGEFLHEIVEGIENTVEIIGNIYENPELLK